MANGRQHSQLGPFVTWTFMSAGLYVVEALLIWSIFFAALGSGRERTSAVEAGFWLALAAHQVVVFASALVVARLLYLPILRSAILTAAALLLLLFPTLLIFGLEAACRTGDCI